MNPFKLKRYIVIYFKAKSTRDFRNTWNTTRYLETLRDT